MLKIPPVGAGGVMAVGVMASSCANFSSFYHASPRPCQPTSAAPRPEKGHPHLQGMRHRHAVVGGEETVGQAPGQRVQQAVAGRETPIAMIGSFDHLPGGFPGTGLSTVPLQTVVSRTTVGQESRDASPANQARCRSAGD